MTRRAVVCASPRLSARTWKAEARPNPHLRTGSTLKKHLDQFFPMDSLGGLDDADNFAKPESSSLYQSEFSGRRSEDRREYASPIPLLRKNIEIRPNLGPKRMDAPNPALQRLSHFAEDAGAMLFSRTPSPWAGFRLERHSLSPGREKHLYWPTPRLGLVRAGSACVEERRTEQGDHRFIAGKNSVTIWPGGYQLAILGWSGRAEIIDVDILSNSLEVSAEFDFRCVELAAQSNSRSSFGGARVRHGC